MSSLNPNRTRGHVSPHKVAMLMATMDLIENNVIGDNQIIFSDALATAFTENFERLKNESDRNNPHLPFFHLRSSTFWHHKIKPGQSESYAELATASGPGTINKHIDYAYLDDELFELLKNKVVRELLKTALIQNLEITNESRSNFLKVDGWDWLECEACVADYFTMLHKELHNKSYNKTQHRRSLGAKLENRSEGSIEFKHQNISAVLVEIGFPYISGYKPRFNYQGQLRDVVLAHLAGNQHLIDSLTPTADLAIPQYISSWDNVLDEEVPALIPPIVNPERKFLARKPNYTKLEADNRVLGASGEEFVIEFEQKFLADAGRPDLAKEVEWSSKERGDGLGYDVRSFVSRDGVVTDQEHFIEVKTTNSGKHQPFYISENEVAFSKEFRDQYSLYRVYDFKARARLFRLPGSVDSHVNLKARMYQASFA